MHTNAKIRHINNLHRRTPSVSDVYFAANQSPATPAPDTMPTTESLPVIRNYQFVRTAGSGGMSTVYEAIDTNLKRQVAIKVLHSHLFNDPAARERFRREALAAASLDHPNIVRVYDYIFASNTHCIVMEWVAGPDAESVVKQRGSLPFETVRFVMSEVAAGLAQAHSKGVLHRDVKPSNILLHRGNRVLLTDFGLARRQVDTRLTQHDAVAGTPVYMSPEQISNRELDTATDIYSWAVTFYNLLSGRLPYRHQAFPEVIADIQHARTLIEEPFRAQIPRKFLSVLERCLVANPSERIRDGSELCAAIAACGAVGPVELGPLMEAARPSNNAQPLTESSITVTQIYRAQRVTPARAILYATLVIGGGVGLFAAALWYLDHSREQTPTPTPAVSAPAPVPAPSPVAPAPAVSDTPESARARPEPSPPPSPARPHPAPDSGRLFIYCSPWANIDVNGKFAGRTPLEKPITLSSGKHVIRLYNDFCEPIEEEVQIASRSTLRKRYSLKVKPAYQK